MTKKGHKKKLKLKIKPLITILVIILVAFFSYTYINNITIKNIYITGNEITTDKEIIEIAGIKDYPKLYKLNKKQMKKNINELPLIDEVKINRNIFGKITIKVKESKILFYYSYNNKYITSTGESIDDRENYYGYATLINFTPDTIFDELIVGLNKLDYNIVRMIDRFEYTPYKAQDGTLIDESRFTLYMNDTNQVVIDTVNIRKLNDYMQIYASLGMDNVKGTLYLDTITEENIYFKSYDTQAAEQAAREEKEKEAAEAAAAANEPTTEVIAQ